MQTFGYYVAIEEKLFEKHGIELESVRFQAPNQIIDSLVSGRADAGAPGAAAGISVLAEVQFPGTFKVFGLQGGGIKVNRINDGLIVSNTSEIKNLADLKGKSLGHLPGIQWKTLSRHVIRKAGLDPDKDVRLTELAVGLQVQAVVAGTVDANAVARARRLDRCRPGRGQARLDEPDVDLGVRSVLFGRLSVDDEIHEGAAGCRQALRRSGG